MTFLCRVFWLYSIIAQGSVIILGLFPHRICNEFLTNFLTSNMVLNGFFCGGGGSIMHIMRLSGILYYTRWIYRKYAFPPLLGGREYRPTWFGGNMKRGRKGEKRRKKKEERGRISYAKRWAKKRKSDAWEVSISVMREGKKEFFFGGGTCWHNF